MYPDALEACDEVDNDCNDLVDDDCVADLPFSHRVDFSDRRRFYLDADYAIYQAFDTTNPLDLDQKTITLAPNAAHTRYTVIDGRAPVGRDVGELVPTTTRRRRLELRRLLHERSARIHLHFYGADYTSCSRVRTATSPSESATPSYTDSVEEFLANAPRIAAFWDDLDTNGGVDGTSTTKSVISRTLTSSSSPTKTSRSYQDSGTSNTFQFVLHADGTIMMSYDGMDDVDRPSLVGITPGSIGTVSTARLRAACVPESA